MKSRDRRALLRQPVELVGQHVQLAGERDLHDQQLLAIDQLGEPRVVLDLVGDTAG